MVSLRLMWGLLVLCVAAASPPRYVRQTELHNYDDNNDVDLDQNVDGDNAYEDYYDGNESEIEITRVDPFEGIESSHSASLEEKEEEELPIKPQLIPPSSGESGTLMGPSAQGEEELRLMPTDILQISGDLSSGDAVPSGDLQDEKASSSGEPSGLGYSGVSGGISGSVDYEDLSSGVSGLSGSGIILISGEEEELHPIPEFGPLEASGESGIFEISGASGLPEGSGEPAVSGVSGEPVSSGVPEVSGVSGASGIPDESGESGVSGVPEGSAEPGISGVSEVSGESGVPEVSGEASGVLEIPTESGSSEEPEVSGESGTSGVPEVSGESGTSGVPEESGTSGVPEESGTSGVPEVSGESGTSGVPEVFGESGTSGVPEVSGESETTGVHEISGESGISVVPDMSGQPETSGVPEMTVKPEIFEVPEVSRKPGPFDLFEESGESGSPEETEVTKAPDFTTTMLIPDLDEVEEILLTTPTTPLEGTGGDIGSGIPDIDTDIYPDITGMSVCVLCTCLVGSVYCDDLKLDRVPPLSKDTTHFYSRYNKISRISKSDFANLNKLKKIDLTSNGISRIDDDAFFGLPSLEELILRENNIRQLPALPPSMTLIDVCHNHLGSTGIQREAFKDMPGLLYLYLTDNNIDHIPVPLPESLRSLHLQNNNIQMIHEDTFCNPHDLNYIRNALEDVRLDSNPINLSRTPQAYICLPRIPIGNLF
ncbi:epiphycan [Danio aesculapii]|uniref:epiphycan n=1 Tax=Danio aesculapii TaxID=1142201 RepID=UPI0024C0D701|nr:epiphycan [Danio aesculapii]XP_056311722.1 epiphycan [Danio aesculapii]